MDLSEVKSIISRYGLHPSKKRGQNFLVSDPMREKIIDAIKLSGTDQVLEIGPGLGSLTGRLAELAGSVVAVEIDSGFCRFLEERLGGKKNIRLIHGDFLKVSVPGPFTKIVSNLPYYCSSEILFKIARYDAAHAYVMLQKELGQRIVAGPGQAAYGALSVTLNFYYSAEVLFPVSREAFFPRPEVTSSFLRLVRREKRPLEGADIDLFHSLVKSAFWGRRKTIRTALNATPHLDIGREGVERILKDAGIDGGRRGEELGIGDYVNMVKAYRNVVA